MLDAIKQFFESNLIPEKSESQDQHVNKIQLASAALLIEVMNSDNEQDAREMEAFIEVLKKSTGLAHDKIDELITLAKRKASQATDLFEFTQLINENYNYEEKLVLIENMWRVAFSDEHLDKYEDHLIRRVAELIYVRHSDFIRTKLQVKDGS